MNVEEMLHSVEGGQDAPGARVVLPEAVKAFIRHLDLRACGKDWPVSEVRREVKKWSDRKDNEYGMTRRVGGVFFGVATGTQTKHYLFFPRAFWMEDTLGRELIWLRWSFSLGGSKKGNPIHIGE